MSTLDVVGKDLQLRLGVDHGVLGQQQVLVGLLGVRLLSVLVHVDLAVENPLRSAGEDAFVELAAAAVRLLVVDPGVVVGVLAAVQQVEAIEGAIAAFSGEHGVGVVPDERATQCNGTGREHRAAVQLRLRGGDVEGSVSLFHQLVVGQHGALADDDLGHGIGEVARRTKTDVALDDHRAAATAHQDQVPGMGHGRFFRGGRDEQQVDRLRHRRPGGDGHERPVLHAGRVERDERVVLARGVAGQVRLERGGIRRQDASEAPGRHPIWQIR